MTTQPKLNLTALYDPSRPVHKIADDLLPYLQVLISEFAPQHVVLFGSYAYGSPNEHSDVDLLVVKPLTQVGWKEAVIISKRWREVRKRAPFVRLELLVEDPYWHEQRLAEGGAFYSDINQKGIALI